jgi:hypothetical protein
VKAIDGGPGTAPEIGGLPYEQAMDLYDRMVDNLLDQLWLPRAQEVTVYGARYMNKLQGGLFHDLR